MTTRILPERIAKLMDEDRAVLAALPDGFQIETPEVQAEWQMVERIRALNIAKPVPWDCEPV